MLFPGKVASIVGVLGWGAQVQKGLWKMETTWNNNASKHTLVACPKKGSMDYTEWRDNLKSFTFEVYLLSKDRPLFSLQFSLLTIKGINPSPSLRSHSASCLSFWMAAFRHRTSPTYRASVLQPDWLAVKYFDPPKLGSSSWLTVQIPIQVVFLVHPSFHSFPIHP